jgi:hypothetical protein
MKGFTKSVYRYSLLIILLSIFASLSSSVFAQKKSYFQLKVYYYKTDSQEKAIENFLKNAYKPALKRAGVSKVGVFKTRIEEGKEVSQKGIYVLVPYATHDQFLKVENKLEKDKDYKEAARDYTESAHNNAPYDRIENVFMEAFAGMPNLKVPSLNSSPAERVYELRSYEAATEKLHQNKIDMFNEGEIQLFERLGFNAVFYGKVLFGSKMPNLMYITSFENMAERQAHWKTFVDDPEWKQMSSNPRYANNFLKADIYLLHPTDYSDI